MTCGTIDSDVVCTVAVLRGSLHNPVLPGREERRDGCDVLKLEIKHGSSFSSAYLHYFPGEI